MSEVDAGCLADEGNDSWHFVLQRAVCCANFSVSV